MSQTTTPSFRYCDKSGYRVVEANRRQVGKHAASPIEVECLLAK